MSEAVIYLRASRAVIREIVRTLPRETVGGSTTAGSIMARCGTVLLGRIRRAFIVKARGGTDEAGDRWAPLKPQTIAYSKTRSRGRGGRLQIERRRGARPSQALDSRQSERWWDLYRQGLRIFNNDKASAAKRAWAILKREGARTLLDKYGHRQVEILRDTGLLLNSLSPGVSTIDQVFRIYRGEVIIGTNRKGASAHHNGVRGKLPKRRLWPPPNKWPSAWWQDLADEVQQGMVEVALQLLQKTK